MPRGSERVRPISLGRDVDFGGVAGTCCMSSRIIVNTFSSLFHGQVLPAPHRGYEIRAVHSNRPILFTDSIPPSVLLWQPAISVAGYTAAHTAHGRSGVGSGCKNHPLPDPESATQAVWGNSTRSSFPCAHWRGHCLFYCIIAQQVCKQEGNNYGKFV